MSTIWSIKWCVCSPVRCLELSWSRDKTETVNVKTEIKIVTLKTKTVKLLSWDETVSQDFSVLVVRLSETRWPGYGVMPKNGHKMIYSGCEDGKLEEGVVLLGRKDARKALMGYKPVLFRTITAYLRHSSDTCHLHKSTS